MSKRRYTDVCLFISLPRRPLLFVKGAFTTVDVFFAFVLSIVILLPPVTDKIKRKKKKMQKAICTIPTFNNKTSCFSITR